MENNPTVYKLKTINQIITENCSTSQRLDGSEDENIQQNNINDITNVDEDIKKSKYFYMINNAITYDEKNIDDIFEKFKDFTFKNNSKEILIDTYIEKFIIKIYKKLKKKIKDNLKNESNNDKQNEKSLFDNYSFNFLFKNLSDSKTEIDKFFSIFDFIKKKLINLTNIDYILFVTQFLKKLELEQEGMLNIWKFINYLYMIKMKIEFEENSKNKNKNNHIDKLLFLNEDNILCETLLLIIIGNFKGDYFYGLYDYIYFKERFMDNEIKKIDFYLKPSKRINSSYYSNNYSYIYEYEDIDEKKQTKWDKYLIDEYKNKKFNIIYNILDYLDSSNYKIRKDFYFKIFEMISKDNNNDLENTEFINALIALIVNDHNLIFKIYSKKKEEEEEKKEEEEEKQKKIKEEEEDDKKNEEKNIEVFKTLIQKVTDKIENLLSAEKINDRKNAELLNSLILFLKLFGEYNNSMFHEIICAELKVIEKLYDLYLQLFISIEISENQKLNNELLKIKLIVFQSLTQCLTEFTNIDSELKKNLKQKLENKKEEFLQKKAKLDKIIEDMHKGMDKSKEDKENIISNTIFLLNNITIFNLFCLKVLGIQNKMDFFLKTLNSMNIYFLAMTESEESINLSFQPNSLEKNKKELLEYYKSNFKNNNKDIFNLILYNYQILFHLSEYLEPIKSLFDINDEKDNIEKALKFLNKLHNGELNRLLVLFSFLKEIHDKIEIISNNEKKTILNTLIPENLNLRKYSNIYFSKLIDYTSRETKLLSIYNYIECFIYDMKKKKTFIEKYTNYRFLEILNFLVLIVENIILTIFYSKSTETTIEEYNKIDNRQNFITLSTFIIIHCIILLLIIIIWFYFRRDIDYFYSLTKYNKEKYELTITLDKKAELLKKEKVNFKEFFPKKIIKYVKDEKYFQASYLDKIIKILEKIKDFFVILAYTLGTIYPFILTLIFLIIYFIPGCQICLIFPLLLMFNLFETLLAILQVFFQQFTTLLLLILYMLIILYLFSWLSFFYIPKIFRYESVDNNGEVVEAEEYICSSAFSCMLYFFNFGLTTEGAIDMNLISYKNNTKYYFGQLFYDLILYATIHMIFFNIFLATITSGFDKMRDIIVEKDNDKNNVCFICQKTRNDCINDSEDFDKHSFNHNKWSYIMFICNIILKDKKELTDDEYSVYQKVDEGNIKWFPKLRNRQGIKKVKIKMNKIENNLIKFQEVFKNNINELKELIKNNKNEHRNPINYNKTFK